MDNQTAQHTLNRARAMHELQLQVGFAVKRGDKPLGYALAAEFVGEALWKKLAAFKPLLLLSPTRAKLLGLKSTAIAAEKLTLVELGAVIAGAKETMRFPLTTTPAPAFAAELVTLAKQSGIIPAVLWLADDIPVADSFMLDEAVLTYMPPVEFIRGETVALPLAGAENTTITSFRARHGTSVHLALVMGDITRTAPLVRVHSSCVTGDLLGSLRCDCGSQLQLALSQMKEAGAGILLYLHQEGRGIGITSKLRAYALQERGLDTFAANEQLGFSEDERDFSIAGELLKALGHTRIRLLTNNPDKIDAFDMSEITITERLPLITLSNTHNHAYLEAKKIKRGHLS